MRNLLIQISLVSGFILLTVLLFIANRKPPEKKTGNMNPMQKSLQLAQSMDSYLDRAKQTLKAGDTKVWEEINKKIETSPNAEKKQWYDSAIVFWDNRKTPDVAAIFANKKAENTNAAADWFYAGQRFYFAVRFAKLPQEQPVLYNNATAALEKGLQLDPKNTDAKIDLAACYVEGSSDPMKGISLLREIEKTDSMNVKLQLNFAFFSVKSQQWDRAISRFKKVLKIDSTYLEAYLHLADAYEQKGEIDSTISSLEQYAAKTDDVLARTTIKEYIVKLKRRDKKSR